MIISRRVCCLLLLLKIVPTSVLGFGRDYGHVIVISDWSILLR